jgi:hypothetical protein
VQDAHRPGTSTSNFQQLENIMGPKPAFTTLLTALALAAPCQASFHDMQIHQVIGGVRADASAQAIELRMRAPGQTLVSFTRVIARDANGANPVLLLDINANVANGNLGSHILLATASFQSATTPACQPDFILAHPIPAPYLQAGRLTFEDDFGTILWSLAFGGTNYHGSNTAAITNDADGNFGPAWPGPLPTTGSALVFQGGPADLSTTNAADYALTTAAPIFFNNNEAAFVLSVAPTCGSADFNCDGDVATDADIESFFACLAGNCPAESCASSADFDGDGDSATDADIEAFFRVLAGGAC